MITTYKADANPIAAPDYLVALDTPCLIIDAAIVERNLARMVDYCNTHTLQLRPHTKTHKSQQIARMQLDCGSIGLTVAKPGEAAVMSELQAEVLIAYPSVTAASLAAIRAGIEVGKILVALDSLEAVERLESALSESSRRVGVLVDIDVGLRRTGLQTPDESVRLAARIDASSGLRLVGLFFYPGHIWMPPDEQALALGEVEAVLAAHLSRWKEKGLSAQIVSGGSTPTAYQTHLVPSVTEIRPGTYVFNDMNTVRGGYCRIEDCAVRILTTVVSNAVPGQVVIDAGSKTMAADRCIPAPESGHGHVVGYPRARITYLSEEHGQVDVSECEAQPGIGDRLTVIPNHVCPTINLTDFAWWLSPRGDVERLSIDARGRVR